MNLIRIFAFDQTTTNHHQAAPARSVDTQGRTSFNGTLSLFLLLALAVLSVAPAFAKALPDYAKLVEEQSAAVVRVTAVAPTVATSSTAPGSQSMPQQIPEQFKRFFEQMPNRPGPRGGAGFGSGFIMSDDGYVVTNAHVVDGAEEIRVSLQDRREFVATLVGADKRTDVALLKIDASDLTAVSLGDSDDLQVGQWVLAIGSPFGFEYTATQGIISAVSRSLRGDSYVPFIQTDAAVNPGNSGGPLFDTDGNVIGVNAQIYTRSGGFMGLSFAIPINVVKNVSEQLKAKGYASYGWLGVLIQDMDKSLAESFGLDRPKGALVSQVSTDSPAQEAGIQTGDVIVSFGGASVGDSSELPPLVGATNPGKTASVEVIRNGEPLTLQVTVRELQQDRGTVKTAAQKPTAPSVLGVKAADLSEQERKKFDIPHGVRAADVAANSPAAKAGIRRGDIIVSFNKADVQSSQQLDQLVESAPREHALPVLVLRNNAPHFIALTVPKA